VLHAPFLLGLISGGAIIYWFTGASTQAVTTGAYRGVEFIKANIKLRGRPQGSVSDSKRVSRSATQYAQKGMFNIFLGRVLRHPRLRLRGALLLRGYLISIALFGSTSDLHGQRGRRVGQRQEGVWRWT